MLRIATLTSLLVTTGLALAQAAPAGHLRVTFLLRLKAEAS